MLNTSYQNCLPEDEPMGSNHVEDVKIKNYNINLEIVHFIGLYFIIIIQCAVQSTQKWMYSSG
jgi:hypothetical protein